MPLVVDPLEHFQGLTPALDSKCRLSMIETGKHLPFHAISKKLSRSPFKPFLIIISNELPFTSFYIHLHLASKSFAVDYKHPGSRRLGRVLRVRVVRKGDGAT